MGTYREYSIPYGDHYLFFRLPSDLYVEVFEGKPSVELSDEEIESAMDHPIGTAPLPDIVQRKKGRAVILINDITRPLPYRRFFPKLIRDLKHAGIPSERITLLVATGVHRPVSPSELSMMLGEEVVKEFSIINHCATEDEEMEDLGNTPSGLPLIINKHFVHADIKILTGLIDLHQTAGFTGGRKSIIPGIAGEPLIKLHHSFPYRGREVALGKLENNLFHISAMEAAKIVGVDFIVNVITNSSKRITKIVTGDLEDAWLLGVEFCKKTKMVTIREKFDIVITSPGGYPRDIDLHQSQKAISPAEIATRPGGYIILVAECRDGLGSQTGTYYRWLKEASHPAEVIERFEKEGWTEASSKAYMFARAMERFKIIVVSDRLKTETLRPIFLDHASSVEEAIEKALLDMGRTAKICILPRGSSIGITHIGNA